MFQKFEDPKKRKIRHLIGLINRPIAARTLMLLTVGGWVKSTQHFSLSVYIKHKK